MSIDDQIKTEREAIARIRKRRSHKSNNRADFRRLRDEAEQILAKKKRRQRDLGPNPSDEHRESLSDDIENVESEIDQLTEKIETLANALVRLGNRIGPRRKRIKRLRERRQEINAQQGQLSPHFFRAEFDCRNGAKVPDSSIPALKDLCHKVLEPQRAKFGSVHVNSGYRTASYNASIGGASNSIHIYDRHPNAVAADHVCATSNASAWFFNTEGKAAGRGRYSSFHHADNRNRIGWANAVWSG